MKSEAKEEVQFDIKANLKRGKEYVGGKLYITNEYMHFIPHAMNIQKQELIIYLKDIDVAEKANILGISPNGVLIRLNDKTYYKFTIGLPMSTLRNKVINYLNKKE